MEKDKETLESIAAKLPSGEPLWRMAYPPSTYTPSGTSVTELVPTLDAVGCDPVVQPGGEIFINGDPLSRMSHVIVPTSYFSEEQLDEGLTQRDFILLSPQYNFKSDVPQCFICSRYYEGRSAGKTICRECFTKRLPPLFMEEKEKIEEEAYNSFDKFQNFIEKVDK